MDKIQWKAFDVNDQFLGFEPVYYWGSMPTALNTRKVWIYSETHRYSITNNCYDINKDAVMTAIDKVKQFIDNVGDKYYDASIIVFYVPNAYLFQHQVIERIEFLNASLLNELHKLYALECEAARLAEVMYARECDCGGK